MAPAIVSTGRNRPMALIVHGCEGVGKTSFAAHAPGVTFIQTRGEQGLDPLINSGQIPKTPHFEEEAATFNMLLKQVAFLLKEEHNHKTLVVDTGNGNINDNTNDNDNGTTPSTGGSTGTVCGLGMLVPMFAMLGLVVLRRLRFVAS